MHPCYNYLKASVCIITHRLPALILIVPVFSSQHESQATGRIKRAPTSTSRTTHLRNECCTGPWCYRCNKTTPSSPELPLIKHLYFALVLVTAHASRITHSMANAFFSFQIQECTLNSNFMNRSTIYLQFTVYAHAFLITFYKHYSPLTSAPCPCLSYLFAHLIHDFLCFFPFKLFNSCQVHYTRVSLDG